MMQFAKNTSQTLSTAKLGQLHASQTQLRTMDSLHEFKFAGSNGGEQKDRSERVFSVKDEDITEEDDQMSFQTKSDNVEPLKKLGQGLTRQKGQAQLLQMQINADKAEENEENESVVNAEDDLVSLNDEEFAKLRSGNHRYIDEGKTFHMAIIDYL